jgi:hypothetical protein
MLGASITKVIFSDHYRDVEAKTGYFQEQVLLYSKHVFGE